MTKSFIETVDGSVVVHIEGAAVIDSATQIHQVFTEALESQQSIILNTEKITECDSSFIQLIGSLCFTLNRGGRSLEFSKNNLSEPVIDAIKSLGFHFKCKCTRIDNMDCFFTNIVNFTKQTEESVL